MAGAGIKLLVVEDSKEFADLLETMLQKTQLAKLEVLRAATFQAARQHLLANHDLDIILLDLNLPDSIGLNTVTSTRRLAPTLPILVLTGQGDEDLAMEVIRQGAQDYLEKVEITPKLLLRAMRYAIERKHAEEKLEERVRQRTQELQDAIYHLSEEVEARVQTEHKLRESESRYRLLAESVADVIWTADMDGRLTFCSPSVEQLLGYTCEELMRLRAHELFDQPFLSLMKGTAASMREEGPPGPKGEPQGRHFAVQLEMKRKDGQAVWTETRGRVIHDLAGRPTGILGVTRDISEGRRAHREVQRSLQSQQIISSLLAISLLDLPMDALLEQALDLLFSIPWLSLESKACIFLAEGDPKVLVMKAQRGIAPELLERCGRLEYGRCLCGRAAQERRLVFAGHVDEHHEIQSSQGKDHDHYCVPMAQGDEVLGVINLYVSQGPPRSEVEESFLHSFANALAGVIGRRQMQMALRDSEESYRNLVESISEGLVVLDQDAVLTFCNHRFAEMVGKPREELLGQPIGKLIAPHNREMVARQWALRAQGGRDPYETAWENDEGKKVFTLVYPRPITRSDGSFAGTLSLITDITQRKLLESKLMQSQKLEAIGQLAAGIAHEINTPTQYVSDNTLFLRDSFNDLLRLLAKYVEVCEQAGELAPLEELRRQVNEVVEEIDYDYLVDEVPKAIEQTLAGLAQIAKIVRSMKEFAHPGSESKAPADLNSALESTITVARNEWKYFAEVQTDLDPALPLVPCRAGELNQVFLNIIVNAAQAIAEKVAEGSLDKGLIQLSTRKLGEEVEIRVADNGPGIPPEIKDRIFDPFFTTKEPGKGTGQGLAIAHRVITELHGGELAVESTPGQGTTFIIRLPLEPETA